MTQPLEEYTEHDGQFALVAVLDALMQGAHIRIGAEVWALRGYRMGIMRDGPAGPNTNWLYVEMDFRAFCQIAEVMTEPELQEVYRILDKIYGEDEDGED